MLFYSHYSVILSCQFKMKPQITVIILILFFTFLLIFLYDRQLSSSEYYSWLFPSESIQHIWNISGNWNISINDNNSMVLFSKNHPKLLEQKTLINKTTNVLLERPGSSHVILNGTSKAFSDDFMANKTIIDIVNTIAPCMDDIQFQVDCKIVVPNMVHFVWFFAGIPNPDFLFHHLMSVLSAIKIQRPERIVFWHDVLPTGQWWQVLLEYVKKQGVRFVLRYCKAPTHIFNKPILLQEHKADIQRIRCIEKYGGGNLFSSSVIYLLEYIVSNYMDDL